MLVLPPSRHLNKRNDYFLYIVCYQYCQYLEMNKYFRIYLPVLFLMLLFMYSCKKEPASKSNAPVLSFIDTFVGTYHVIGTRTPPGGPTEHFDRNDTILSGGTNALVYRGVTYYYYSGTDSVNYEFDNTGSTYYAYLTFPKPFNDSVYFTSYWCIDPRSCTYTNLQGTKNH